MAGQEDKKNQAEGEPGKEGEKKEGEEDEEEEQELRNVGKSLVKETTKKITFYQPPKPFQKKEMFKEEKIYNELIEIENLDKEYHNPFMQIIIGGDYRIEFGKGAGTKTKFAKFEGELGLMFKTEVIKNLEPRNPQRFTTDIETEYRASYFDIKRQYIYFEVWNWNGWQLNNFFDLKSLEIEEVVQSEDLHFEMIFQREMKGGKKFNTMRVRLKLAFEQIWDYAFYFMEWRTSQLLIKDTRNLSLEIKVAGRSGRVISPKQDGPICQWPVLKGEISLRSTALLLSQQLLLINLKKSGRTIGFQTIPLRALLQNSQISTTLTVKTPGSENRVLLQIQGMSVLHSKPKYLQGGASIEVYEKNYYLVCQIRSCDVKDALEDLGLAQYFVQLAWGGVLQRTRLHRREQVNETFYFEIPLDKDTKEDRQKFQEVIKEKLRAESKVKYYLWAFDPVKQTNVNLGNGVMEVAQIINYGEDQKKKFKDKDTKKIISFNTRALNATLQMKSPDTSLHCSIQLAMWFQKDIPLLDMPYDNTTGFQIPIEIRKRLNIFTSAWKQQMEFYVWTFEDEPKDNYEVFKIDQFAQPHFISSFIGKLSMPLTSDDLRPNGNSDFGYVHNSVKLQTMAEIAHWVKCIPYVADKFANAWKTPSFLAQLKRGDQFDHSIMLASLFMGVKYETELDWQLARLKMVRKIKTIKNKVKNQKIFTQAMIMNKFQPEGPPTCPVPLSKRVFVCIGRLKANNNPHAWVMSFDKDLSTVIFWETKRGVHYKLRGRVLPEERRGLIDCLMGQVKLKNKDKKKKRGFREEEDSLIDEEEEEAEEEEFKSANDDSQSELGLTVDDNQEYNSQEDDMLGLELNLRRLVGADQGDVRLEHGLGTGFTKGINFEAKEKQFKVTTGEAKQDNIDDLALKFLQAQRAEFEDKEKKRADKHLEAVAQFTSLSGEEVKDPDLPYKSIDIIFNRMNVWGNMQNRHPANIFYHIHRPGRWIPLVYITKEEDLKPPEEVDDKKKKGKKKDKKEKKQKKEKNSTLPKSKTLQETPLKEQEVSIHLSDDQDEQKQEGEDNIDDHFKPNLWTKVFTPFFEPPSISPAFVPHKAKNILEKILREIKLAIILSQPDPINRWKPPNGKLCKVYKRMLVLKEHLICERIAKPDYKQRMKTAMNDLKSIMPVDFEVRSIPMFFNMIDAEYIKSYAIGQLVPRFINSERLPLKKSVFALTGVIFPYAGQICSIRLMLAVFYDKTLVKRNKEVTGPFPSSTRRSLAPGLSEARKTALSETGRARSAGPSIRASMRSNRSVRSSKRDI